MVLPALIRPEGRDYQELAARTSFPRLCMEGKRAVLLVAPVGSGKTHIACMIAYDVLMRDKADFWMGAHRKELIDQPIARLWKFGIPANRHSPGHKTDPDWPINVFSVDTLAKREIKKCRPRAVVVIDEAHRVVGARWMEQVSRFRAAYGENNVWFALLTATPYRLDGRSLGDVADALVEVTTPRLLIEQGIIMEPRVYGEEPVDMTGVRRVGGDFDPVEKERRVNTSKLVGDVVATWIRKAGGAPSVYFAAGIAHSRHLVERFREVGVRAEHLDGKTPDDERARILARLAIGGRGSDHPEALDVVCNCDILREGWDSESDYERVLKDRSLWLGHSYPPEYQPLEVLGDCSPTQSCCSYRQREGRVCRTHARKTRAVLISHAGNHLTHGFLRDHEGFSLDDRQIKETLERKARVAAYTARQCRECLATWPPDTETCSCGASLAPPPKILRESDAELTEVTNTFVVRPPDPREEYKYLVNLWKWWARKNLELVSRGKAARTEIQLAWIFKKKYSRWPAQPVLKAARQEAGV